jgi:hypothetical protein
MSALGWIQSKNKTHSAILGAFSFKVSEKWINVPQKMLLKKFNRLIKNAEFGGDSNPLKKLPKSHLK